MNAILKTLLSIRPTFHRMNEVLYMAPGYLHGTYMLQKRGPITQDDLIKHAIQMRYGVGHMSERKTNEVSHIRIHILEVR